MGKFRVWFKVGYDVSSESKDGAVEEAIEELDGDYIYLPNKDMEVEVEGGGKR